MLTVSRLPRKTVGKGVKPMKRFFHLPPPTPKVRLRTLNEGAGKSPRERIDSRGDSRGDRHRHSPRFLRFRKRSPPGTRHFRLISDRAAGLDIENHIAKGVASGTNDGKSVTEPKKGSEAVKRPRRNFSFRFRKRRRNRKPARLQSLSPAPSLVPARNP